MEQFDLNKLYYDKNGVKLYGHDMLRLAINKLFFRQRTLALKVFTWVFIISSFVFYQYAFLETYQYTDNLPFVVTVLVDIISFICAPLAAIYAVFFLLIHGISYLIFTGTDEFRKRSNGLSTYKKSFRKMTPYERDSLINIAKETIMNTPSIRKDFQRQFNKLSALNNSLNQSAHNVSQTTTYMAYTGQQQVYTGFDTINCSNNNNKR
ncbi:hypothetical protein [Fangia hongkongensis]|uniref:hypothetical protein n=1 Tax=Fangia hongkongensis TaxID=270495 RepID=UPI000361AE9C|nr:hypothetical protein [Fangia hongkongensis]MBK2123712.1 hypothetical protein [Fangia hongkongensis]